MKAKAMINAAITQAARGPRAARVPAQGQPSAIFTRAPEALGQGDAVMIFREALVKIDPDLVGWLDRMVQRAPQVANQVIAASALGEISRGRAVRALVEYRSTRVAQAPQGL